MPAGDVFVHCGDWCKDFGSAEEMKEFADWVESLPYDVKIVIAGNHDFPAQDNDARCKANFNSRGIFYLKDSGVKIKDRLFWGSPWQPEFGGLAFNLPRGGRLWDKWRRIPLQTEVLITHGPPFGILDNARWPGDLLGQDESVGCKQLLRRVNQVRPLVHAFGHIHVSAGVVEVNGTTFINASTVKRHVSMGTKPTQALAERDGGLLHPPVVFDLPEKAPQ